MIHTYTAHLVKKTNLSSDIYRFSFVLDTDEVLEFIPGQYLILFVPQLGKDYARRLFSIISTPSQKDSFELLVQILPKGLASQYLLSVEPHEDVVFQGPAGMFKFTTGQKKSLFLATGTGIAPFRSILLSHLSNHRFSVELLWGIKTYNDLYLLDELKELAKKHKHFSFKVCLSREQSLEQIPQDDRPFIAQGRITNELEKTGNLSYKSEYHYYLCGAREVIESLRQLLYSKGIEKDKVTFEKF